MGYLLGVATQAAMQKMLVNELSKRSGEKCH